MVGDDPAISESEPRCERASLCPLTLGTGEEAFSMQGQWQRLLGLVSNGMDPSGRTGKLHTIAGLEGGQVWLFGARDLCGTWRQVS